MLFQSSSIYTNFPEVLTQKRLAKYDQWSYLTRTFFGKNRRQIGVNPSGLESIKWWHHQSPIHTLQSESSIYQKPSCDVIIICFQDKTFSILLDCFMQLFQIQRLTKYDLSIGETKLRNFIGQCEHDIVASCDHILHDVEHNAYTEQHSHVVAIFMLNKYHPTTWELQWRIWGGAPGAPPLRPKIFSISCSFSENLTKSYVGAPPRGSAPPPTGNPGSAPELCVEYIITDISTAVSYLSEQQCVCREFCTCERTRADGLPNGCRLVTGPVNCASQSACEPK